MALTPEQIEELKDQLRDQVDNLPDDQKAQALKQIDSMSSEAIESMLKQQKSVKEHIFREIVAGDIPSKKVDENKDAIAVLDIKPISKGHVIIIPKKHALTAKDIPSSAFTLAKKLTSRVIKKLEAKGTEIQSEFKFKEMILNVIPIYDHPLSLNSPRIELGESEMENVYKKLKAVKKEKKIKKSSSKKSSIIRLKRRVP